MTVWDILFCKSWQSLGNGALQVIFIIIINNLFMTQWCIILKVSAVIGDVKVSKGKEWIKHLSKISRVLVCLMTFYVRNTPLFKSETIRMVTNSLFSFLLDSIQCIHDNRKKQKLKAKEIKLPWVHKRNINGTYPVAKPKVSLSSVMLVIFFSSWNIKNNFINAIF